MNDDLRRTPRAISDNYIYHTIPLDDLREHISNKNCWCNPTKNDDENVYVHHSMDRREEYEDGRRKPS